MKMTDTGLFIKKKNNHHMTNEYSCIVSHDKTSSNQHSRLSIHITHNISHPMTASLTKFKAILAPILHKKYELYHKKIALMICMSVTDPPKTNDAIHLSVDEFNLK